MAFVAAFREQLSRIVAHLAVAQIGEQPNPGRP